MKYISICSGIEAASVAWEGFGWTPLAFSEIEAFPSTVLAHHYPGVPNLGDMTKFEYWPEEILAQCDILVGGPPCQAFSVAGLRKSLQDERGNVTLSYVRLLNHIDEVRRRHGRPPVVAVYENVPGLLSTKDNAFGCLVGALCGCDEAPETETGKWPKAGFLCGEARRVGYRVLDAQYFGVAQRRRRIFLVAVPCELVERLGERACPSEILSLRESMRGNPPTRGTKGEGVTSATPGGTRSGGEQPYFIDRASFNQGQNAQYEAQIKDDGLALSLVARGPGAVAINDELIWRGGDQANSEHCIGHAGTLNCDKGQQGGIVAFKPGQSEAAGGTFVTEEFAPTIQGQSNGSTAVPAVAFKPSHFTRGKDGKPSDQGDTRATTVVAFTTEQTPKFKDDCALTMTKQSPSGGCRLGDVHATLDSNKGSRRVEGVMTPMSVRRLTPQECERLQGFPDDYTAITYRNKPAADGPRYKALGNSMAVPCMWWIGMRIAKATEQE